MSYRPRHAAKRPARGVRGASVGSGLPGSGGVPAPSRRTARVVHAEYVRPALEHASRTIHDRPRVGT